MNASVLTSIIATLGTIGLATALLLPGRQTPAVLTAGGNALGNVFGSVITGK